MRAGDYMRIIKKKKETNVVGYNVVFGNLTYSYCWWTDTPIVVKIFGKDFPMKMRICTDNKNDPVNTLQENLCRDLRGQISEIEKRVEDLLVKEFPFPKEAKRSELFSGGCIAFSTKGKCGMMMDVSEDYYDEIDLEELGIFSGNSFCICLLPDIFIVRNTEIYKELFD